MTDETEPTQEELEALFVNNDDLGRLDDWLGRFNPIRVLGVADREIRHSNVIGWLLDPRETHGLGESFLRAFLSEAERGSRRSNGLTALALAQADLRDADIRREWRNIDILVHLPRLKFAWIIENKYHATQHDGQLDKYRKRVRRVLDPHGEGLDVRGIFLTLRDEKPQDRAYRPLRYEAVCKMISTLLRQRAEHIHQGVRSFLSGYLDVIAEEAGVSEEQQRMVEVARQLYLNHRKALDFVMAHGAPTDFNLAVETAFGADAKPGATVRSGGQELILDRNNGRRLSFLPKPWDDALAGTVWPGCEKWWARRPLICWVELEEDEGKSTGRLKFRAEVGSLSNHAVRTDLIQRIKTAAERAGHPAIKFQASAENEGARYSRFVSANAHVDDVRDPDKIARAMESLIERMSHPFEAVAACLPEFVAALSPADGG